MQKITPQIVWEIRVFYFVLDVWMYDWQIVAGILGSFYIISIEFLREKTLDIRRATTDLITPINKRNVVLRFAIRPFTWGIFRPPTLYSTHTF